jgi:hypothetical protein
LRGTNARSGRTQSALRAYQKEQNLPQTGQLDDQTRQKLGIP